jgi:hypothetical protein
VNVRVRLFRGVCLPPGAMSVARGSRWGNPNKVGAEGVPDRATAVALYAAWVEAFRQRDPVGFERWLAPLRGHDLACYCPLDGGPCHAYTLLRLAAEEALPASKK